MTTKTQVYRQITLQTMESGYKVYLPGETKKVKSVKEARELVDSAWKANRNLVARGEPTVVIERNESHPSNVYHPLELMTPAEQKAWVVQMAGMMSELVKL